VLPLRERRDPRTAQGSLGLPCPKPPERRGGPGSQGRGSDGGIGFSAESVIQPRAMRYSTHRPVRIQITTATGKPMNVTNTIPPTTSHNTANQNVRICQPKCESSHVPRTSERFA